MTNKKQLVIIGAGGHAKVCYDIALLMNKWKKINVFDDNPKNDYFEVEGSIVDSTKYIRNSDFFVAIGDNKTREDIIKKLTMLEVNMITLIHPNSIIATDVKIGLGSVVMAGVVINNSTAIGKGCIINTSSSIDHDNSIGNFVNIGPGSHLAGTVAIGNYVSLGIGVNVINNISITDRSIVGAGGLVVNNLEASDTYIGFPVRRKNENITNCKNK